MLEVASLQVLRHQVYANAAFSGVVECCGMFPVKVAFLLFIFAVQTLS